MTWYYKRQRDPYTHAISLVVSKGFGRSVSLTLWWFTVGYHRRDKEMERLIGETIKKLEGGESDAS